MITLKLLKWSNAFSYGADNSIDFTANQLTQLVGKNGHGKSSIALILEEVLFNKNSKGTKKGAILNRYSGANAYHISLQFLKNSDTYLVETRRGSTQTVKLSKNGVDISSHTSTATYKQIEDIIGMDHKTFTQIVYQSHAGSLEFLTAPDTARKKFLIELLNLGRYTAAGEVFKTAAAELSKEVAVAEAKVTTVSQWLAKYREADLSVKTLQPVPELPDTSELDMLNAQLLTLEQTNKRISQNNTYRSLEAKARVATVIEVVAPTPDPELITKNAAAKAEYDAAAAFVAKMSKLHGVCPTCLSEINSDKIAEIVGERRETMLRSKEVLDVTTQQLQKLEADTKLWQTAQKNQVEWEKYHQLIDPELPLELLDATQIAKKVEGLRAATAACKAEIKAIEKHNATAEAHNAKVAVIEAQVAEMTAELSDCRAKVVALTAKLGVLNTLVKTFSTTGLVAYKLENLVKDLESVTNQYLGELSGGRFQIGFEIAGSDKLNVIITDNGANIEIQELSGGERARVNVAALLAIRKLMQSLSQSRINLLILDETVEALDTDGKEKLIEVLLSEESLNTLLVSHGFSHPLLDKVHVIKHNNISRIEG